MWGETVEQIRQMKQINNTIKFKRRNTCSKSIGIKPGYFRLLLDSKYKVYPRKRA